MKHSKKIKVWVIYQGKRGIEIVNKLAEKMIAEESKTGAVFNYSKDKYSSAQGTVLTRVMDDVNDNDIAVAIVTKDGRKASMAGNIWFEVGLWMAQKDNDNLLICVEENEDVELISDLKGIAVVEFGTENERLWENMQSHIHKAQSKYASNSFGSVNNVISARQKIQTTYAPYDKRWHDKEPFKCIYQPDGKQCDFRESSLEFSAELLRMGRSNRELAFFKCSLYKLSTFFGDLVEVENRYQLTKNVIDKARMESILILMKLSNEFFNQAEDLLMNSGRNYKHELGIYERIIAFIEYRLKVSLKIWRRLEVSDLVKDVEINFYLENKETKNFVDFLKNIQNEITVKNQAYNVPIEDSAKRKLYFFSNYCSKVATVLDALGKYYFGSCRSVFKNYLPNVNNNGCIHIDLKSIISDFPHNNVKDDNCIRIWPEN